MNYYTIFAILVIFAALASAQLFNPVLDGVSESLGNGTIVKTVKGLVKGAGGFLDSVADALPEVI
uniref:Uncharacterized protein n=1 Tax=Glossina brevipalpis TaxID=37001 RepID=A0A1A9X4M3_9MUSC